MAPEVFRAYNEEDDGATEGPRKQTVTQAVDVYSFGLVLWQLLTGEHPDKTQGSLRQPRQASYTCCHRPPCISSSNEVLTCCGSPDA